jgi:methyl-accepting chemotaxis protein
MTDAEIAADPVCAKHTPETLTTSTPRRRTLRRHILWLVAGLNIVSTIVACTVAYKFQKEAFLHGLDKLLVAGAMSAEDIFGTEYHDRLQRAEEITPAEELEYVKRISELTKQLKLHYIGALVRREGAYFYSITSSPDKEIAGGTYDHIWTRYNDATPALMATFEDGKKRFEEHSDSYGSFRSAYVPFKRVGDNSVYYVYVADVDLAYVYAELTETLWKTALAGLVICAGSIVCCWLLANYAAGPMMKLAGVIRTVVSRDFAMEPEQQAVLASVASRSVEEVANVADAFRRM